MKLYSIWAREPSIITTNKQSLGKLITKCELAVIKPKIPPIRPMAQEDKFVYFVASSILIHPRNPGKYSKVYTQFATIREQCSVFSNLFLASKESAGTPFAINLGSLSNAIISNCPTTLIWFGCCSSSCEAQMGFILKQKKAISINLLKAMISSLVEDIQNIDFDSIECWKFATGLMNSIIITFFASLQGNKGLKAYYPSLIKSWNKEKLTQN